jgi:hypothetical protein
VKSYHTTGPHGLVDAWDRYLPPRHPTAELMSAARRGEAFELETGCPLSMTRTSQHVDWYKFACDYMDMKWPTAAATYRRSISQEQG